jgi:hypothetical protein
MARLFAPKPAPPPAEPPRVEAPPQPGLTKDQVKELLDGALGGVADRLAGTVAQLNEKVEALASRQPQVVVQSQAAPPVANHGPTDAEIDAAVMSGQGAASRIRMMIDRAVNETAQRLVKEHIEPLQAYGVNTLGELSRRITAGNMPHYNRYRKEIDERLNALAPEVRANPAVIEMVYNSVVGVHTTELTREAAEAAVRQAQEAATAAASGTTAGKGATPGTAAGSSSQRDTSADVPTVEQVGGREGLEALAHKGRGGQGADEFARSMGYKDWSDYQKQYDDLLKGESQGNA